MPEWLHIIIRSILFLSILFLMTKIIGKKQISELSVFEYISGITIGSIAGEVIMGLEDSLFHGIIGILTFGITTFTADFISLKSKKFRDIFEGKSTVLIQDGKILEDNLKKEKYTIDDMSALLRQKDVFNVADVEFALLEPNGELSVLLKKENQPLTPKDLNLQVAQEKEPQTVIMDGQILDDALSAAGKTRRWLNIELEKLGVLLENVFMAQVDSYGELTVDIFDDKINVPSPQARPLLLAMIKKSQADLELFALETDSEKAKKMYRKNAEKLKKTMEKLTPYLSEPLQ
ncbi:hypothetical protein C0966_06085 [Bacillus methanolicus]|uniref:DUF421 domain-containing protein n=1 Tax=Bacillus methanolicus TaxID=1471 RepID=UPI00238045B0|nr:DUF421 domain-containing protein [Bacillus methanolicus]MDE3838945.1 hypothetical protein [Bacillus methanolicus]